jgi:hypothetical protein
MMDVKTEIADYAREFYRKPITPYDFIMARIDNSDFTLHQLFRDDVSTKVFDIDYQTNFIFAYEVPREAINAEVLPALSEEELKHVNAKNEQDVELEETKGSTNKIEESKED